MGFVKPHSKHLRNNVYDGFVHVSKCKTMFLLMVLLVSLTGFTAVMVGVKIPTFDLQLYLFKIYLIIIISGFWLCSVMYALYGFEGLFVKRTKVELFIQAHICLAQDLANYLKKHQYHESRLGGLLVKALMHYFWVDLTALEKTVQILLIIFAGIVEKDVDSVAECIMYVSYQFLWICDDWTTLTCFQSNVSNSVVSGDMGGGWYNSVGIREPRLSKHNAKFLREQFRVGIT